MLGVDTVRVEQQEAVICLRTTDDRSGQLIEPVSERRQRHVAVAEKAGIFHRTI